MDERLQQLIRESGDAPAFPGPLSGLPHERGMTYRQWLIGRTLPECVRDYDGDWRKAVDISEDAFIYADAIIERLSRERLEREGGDHA